MELMRRKNGLFIKLVSALLVVLSCLTAVSAVAAAGGRGIGETERFSPASHRHVVVGSNHGIRANFQPPRARTVPLIPSAICWRSSRQSIEQPREQQAAIAAERGVNIQAGEPKLWLLYRTLLI
jgi:hypothetical protein